MAARLCGHERRRGVGWHRISDLVRAWADAVAERRRSRRCRVLLVDETSIRRGHRHVTGDPPEFHNIVDTFINRSNEIHAWHHAGRPSNGRIEGTNNLLQVLRRTAHGFTNTSNFEARALLMT